VTVSIRRTHLVFVSYLLLATPVVAQQTPVFTPGNLVIVVEGCGVFADTCVSVANGTGTGTGNSSAGGYGDNQAARLTLFQYAPAGTRSATFVNSLVLPQSASGPNLPVSAEYGSSSEGTIQLSGNGYYLAVAGYGINADVFNAAPATYGAAPSNALAQSGSLTGQTYTPVARVAALIDAYGGVNSTTALFNVFNLNNPRSIYTADGTTAYVSGQGAGSDTTAGVFYTPLGANNNTPTPVTGLDTTGNTFSQDTRTVQIYNNTLYVSVDTKGGSNSARDFVGTLGTAGSPPTSAVGGPTILPGFSTSGITGKVTITAAPNSNGNGLNAGQQINISPSNFFFATPSILYVADTGAPKNNSNPSTLGNGGLEKWINSQSDGAGTWSLAYTLYKGLNLVVNTTDTGTSGLYGLTGTVSGGSALLYATNSTLSDLDPTYLYGITDTLASTAPTQAASETFTQLAAAPSDSNFKGISFAPSVNTAASPANLLLTQALSKQPDGSYELYVTLSDNGGTTATGVVITSAKIGSTSISATPLPQTIGAIAAGDAATATFSIPASAGASGARVILTITGTSNTVDFGGSERATLP